jgi:hypothetical protein
MTTTRTTEVEKIDLPRLLTSVRLNPEVPAPRPMLAENLLKVVEDVSTEERFISSMAAVVYNLDPAEGRFRNLLEQIETAMEALRGQDLPLEDKETTITASAEGIEIASKIDAASLQQLAEAPEDEKASTWNVLVAIAESYPPGTPEATYYEVAVDVLLDMMEGVTQNEALAVAE